MTVVMVVPLPAGGATASVAFSSGIHYDYCCTNSRGGLPIPHEGHLLPQVALILYQALVFSIPGIARAFTIALMRCASALVRSFGRLCI